MAINNSVNANQAGVQCLTSAGVWNGRTITAGTGISVTNGDGVSGNPTISATGGSSPSTTVTIYEDFCGLLFSNSSAVISDYAWSNGTGASANFPVKGAAVTGHPGIVAIYSDTNGPDHGLLIKAGTGLSADNPEFIQIGQGQIEYETVINLSVLGNVSQNYQAYAGISNVVAEGTEATDGIYFFYNYNSNSGNWICRCRASSANTDINTSVAASTSWIKLGIVINAAGSSVQFYINGVSQGTTSTGLPTGNYGPFWQMINVAGADEKFMNIDYINYMQTLTSAR